MTRFLRLTAVALAIALLSSSSFAGVRYILSTSNTRPGGGAASVPSLTDLDPGAEVDLHIWASFTGSNQFVNGYSLDLRATTPGVVEAVSSTILNSSYVFNVPGGGQFPSGSVRWPSDASSLIEQPQLNTNGALLWNGGAATLSGRGIDKVLGINPATTAGNLDPLFDATNNAFLIQSVKLRVLDGAGGLSTGLVMHVGGRAMGVDNATTPQQIFFGTGATSVPSDGAGMTDGSIHAMLSVVQTGRPNYIGVGGDPAGGTPVPFDGRIHPVDIPIGAPAAKLVIDSQWQIDSFFDVFFDVTIGPGANTDLAGLLADLEGQGLDVIPGVMLATEPNPTSYDFGLRFPGTPGENLVLDFDFGANGTTGVTVESVGVPEPSTLILAALGCVGLLGLRRRKA